MATDDGAAAAGAGAIGFDVDAKHACPHATAHCLPLPATPPLPDKCSECKNEVENWLCLHCHIVFCGRHASGHMLAHSTATGHVIALGYGDLSFWCYSCDSYLHHLTIPEVWQVYLVVHQQKFGHLPEAKPLFLTGPASAAAEKKAATPPPTTTTTTTTAPAKAEAKSDINDLPVEGLTATQLALPIVDRLLGCIYGNALGDAVGLATEFMDKRAVEAAYPGVPIPFPHFKRNHHNRRWRAGDWTDDTDQMILILETLIERKSPDEREFARKLRNWIEYGFPDLGDSGGMGLGMTVASVCMHRDFLDNPHGASQEIWLRSGKQVAANGAVMRTSILGCWEYTDLAKVAANTERIAKVTHWDPRCVASCVAITSLIALILQGRACATAEDCETLIQEIGTRVGPTAGTEHGAAFLAHLNYRTLAELKLDDGPAIGYTLKCFGCGIYGMRSQADFKTTIQAVVREAGDADTNGAVAGAILGAKLGYSRLPRDWVAAMPHKKWLDKKVSALLASMGVLTAPTTTGATATATAPTASTTATAATTTAA